MPALAEAMWTHGTSMVVEFPDKIAKLWKAGFYMQIEGKPNTTNWLHFAIPTTVIVDDRRLRVGSVMLLCETLSANAVIQNVHVYDGSDLIATHDDLNISGNAGFVRFDIPNHPAVKWGLGISVGVSFSNGEESRVMRFKSAGCDFIP